MFGETLKGLRKELKMGQVSFADFLGVEPRTYGSWERNERQPSFEVLCSVADKLNVTTDYLLGRTPMQETIHYVDQLPDLSGKEKITIPPDGDATAETIERLIEQALKKRGL